MGENQDAVKKRIIEGTTPVEVPKAVIGPEFSRETVPLRDAWIGTLKDKRYISSAIEYTTKILPGMSHLKRCSGRRLVLTYVAPREAQQPSSSEGNERGLSLQELEDLFSSDETFDRSIFEKNFEIVAVPAVPPRTKNQARRASEIWPLNFHPDPYIESTLNGSCFDSDDLEIIDRCTRACIEAAAREACGNEDCNGSALVYDHVGGEILALAASSTHRHPMWHAAMLAVDLVATAGRGGAYDLSEKSANRKRRYSSSNQNPQEPPLVYPPTLAAIVQRLELPRGAATKGRSDESRYLCTNYWVFLLREPCPMCAMALVHSRVSNIFYSVPNEKRGVLGSRALLHAVPGLNHRYRVWNGVREVESRQTWIEISRGR